MSDISISLSPDDWHRILFALGAASARESSIPGSEKTFIETANKIIPEYMAQIKDEKNTPT